jgi:hypothetical protein
MRQPSLRPGEHAGHPVGMRPGVKPEDGGEADQSEEDSCDDLHEHLLWVGCTCLLKRRWARMHVGAGGYGPARQVH